MLSFPEIAPAPEKRIVAVYLHRLPLEHAFFGMLGLSDGPASTGASRPRRSRRAPPSRSSDDRPCAVSSDIRGRSVLVEVSPSARAKGVCPGVSVTEARARLPEIEIKKRDLKGELERLEAAAELLFAYGPTVEVQGPSLLFVEIGRSTRVLERLLSNESDAGVEEKLARHLIRALEMRGHEATVAIAKDPITARTLATHLAGCRKAALSRPRRPAQAGSQSDTWIVPNGREEAALAPLPIEALLWTDALDDPEGLERERLRAVHASLRVLGIHDVARLLTLPSAQVASRFGDAGAMLIERARARLDRPLRPFTPPSRIIESLELESPIDDLEPLLFLLKRLLSRIEARLEARSASAGALKLTFEIEPGLEREILSDGARSKSSRHDAEIAISLARPTRRASTFLLLCREKLQGALPGVVLGMTIEALSPAKDYGAQLDLFTSYAKKVEEVGELIGRLKASLGDNAVFSPEVSDAHRPESAWRTRPFEIERAFAAPREERRVKKDVAISAGTLACDRSARDTYILPEVEESLLVAEMPELPGLSIESILIELEQKKKSWPKAVKQKIEDEPVPQLPPRPLELFDPPERATLIAVPRAERSSTKVKSAAGVLAWRGDRLHLASLSGCERLEAEWWTTSPLEREYVIAEMDDGRNLWLFFEPSGELFVHGAFD